MRVIINKEESYELSLPEEIPIAQLGFVIDRLHKLMRVFGKELVLTDIDKAAQPAKGVRRKYISWTRKKALAVLKTYYRTDIPLEEKKALIEKELPYKTLQSTQSNLKKRYKIEDFEVKA